MKPKVTLEVMNSLRAIVKLPPVRSLTFRREGAVIKLSHAERCELLAFILCGVPDLILQAVFEVSDNTTGRMRKAFAEQDGRTYFKVVAERMNYNTNREFCAKFITEEKERAVVSAFPQFARPLD